MLAIHNNLIRLGLTNIIPDKMFLNISYYFNMHEKLNLNAPKTFNEKLQWLKLYDRNPKYISLVDKLAVKQYISKTIGKQYVINTLGVWEKFEDIDFNQLPNQFVLKCTHDSGGLVICKDKSKLDIENAKHKINKCLNKNFYYWGREWPYKGVKPRIIAEKYMHDKSNPNELTDYKFYCFNGVVDCVMVCLDRGTGDTKFYFFDKDWNLKRINKRGKEAPKDFTLPKPSCIDKMFEIASLLSDGCAFMRVDLYECNSQIYFGELTFYPQSGFDPNYLKETDLYFGSMIDLKLAYSYK